MKVNILDIQTISQAISTIVEYEVGYAPEEEPYYSQEDYEVAIEVLKENGLEYDKWDGLDRSQY